LNAVRKAITIFGSSKPTPGDPAYERAHAIGRALAEAGFDLINGGHEGTMGAVSAGGREAGAFVLGVTTGVIRNLRGISINRYLHASIDAPTLFTRIEIMLRRASGCVILPGGTGTLAELGLAVEHVAKGFMSPRPIVFVGDAWKPAIAAAAETGPCASLHWADTPQQVVDILRAHAIALPEAERNFTAGEEWVRVNE
jgi:hypothetical protein